MAKEQNFIPPIPIMQVRPGCILYYDQSFYSYAGQRNPYLKHNERKIINEKYTGKMNAKSKSRLRFAINLLVEQARWKEFENPSTGRLVGFKVNFITLTLSGKQRHVTDRIIKTQMLAPWIKNMRNVHDLRSYVWRAERQKNGNLHFHFSTDTFIPYDAIRDSWNFQQSKFHFIDEFRGRNNSEFPNSTDVHGVFSIKNLASYMVKYMCKDEKGLESIEGKVWDCSQNLKTKERVIFEMSIDDFRLFEKLGSTFKDRVYFGDQCSIIPLSRSEMSKYLPREHLQKYDKWISDVYQAARPKSIKRI